MTCVAGLIANGRVYMGADSAGCSGWDLQVRADAKVFQNGPYLIGFTGSFRMGDLLHYSFTPDPPPEGADLRAWMVTRFIEGARAALKAGGYAKKENEAESAGQFLVGFRDHLFIVDSDYQVGVPADPFAAWGCGAHVALGSLFTTNYLGDTDPHRRLLTALQAAERFSNGVRGPFTILEGRP